MRFFNKFWAIGTLAAALFTAAGCDSGGLPIALVVDDYTMDVNMDQVMNDTMIELQNLGVVNSNTAALPILWPASMPEFVYNKTFTSEPVAVDLTPDEGTPEAELYGDIGSALKIVKRIDINRMVLRFEKNSLTMATPEFYVQVADKKDTHADARLEWRTIGTLPSKPAGWVGDIDFQFVPSGERFLKYQLMDKDREFALRIKSTLHLNMQNDEPLPSGRATIRLILAGTFFVDTLEVINNADELIDTQASTN